MTSRCVTSLWRQEEDTHLEPVNGAAVDEGRELSQPVSEGVANRTEGYHDVQVLSAPVHEEGEQGQWAEVRVLVASLRYWANCLDKENQCPILKRRLHLSVHWRIITI